jgi:EpsD family peptidyl-prolyl cis-trans isomerase
MAMVTLTACEKKPTGQVIAVVNDEEITQQELDRELAGLNLPKDRVPPDARAKLLQRIVDRNLLADYAKKNDLDGTPDYIAAKRKMEQTLLAETAARKLLGSPAPPAPSEIDRFIAKNPTLFGERQRLVIDYVRFQKPKDPQRLSTLMDMGSLEAVTSSLATDKVPFQRGRMPLDTASVDPAIAAQIISRPDGGLLEMTRGDRTVIGTIIQRAKAPPPQARWKEIAAAALVRQTAGRTMEAAMENLRHSARITYSDNAMPSDGPKP